MHAAQRVVFRFQAWALTLNITHSFRYGKDLSNITFAHVEGGGASLEASVGPSLLGDNTAPRAPSTPPLPELEIEASEAEQEALMSMVEMGLNDVQVRISARLVMLGTSTRISKRLKNFLTLLAFSLKGESRGAQEARGRRGARHQ
jgi:hypothetical protein